MVELIKVSPSSSEMEVFKHLLQLYEYEFSDITRLEVGHQGLFMNKELEDNLSQNKAVPFLLRYKEKWAGLAVVNLKSYLNDDPLVKDVAEFFVMKLYRNHHLGQKMAQALFNLFPGKWEVRELPDAKEARAFWLKVIDRLTEHRFEDKCSDHPRWKGYIQSFTIRT